MATRFALVRDTTATFPPKSPGHSTQRAVNPTCDQQKAGLELLEEHNALATVATGQQDQNGAGGDAGAQLRGLGSEAAVQRVRHVVGGVVLLGLGGGGSGLGSLGRTGAGEAVLHRLAGHLCARERIDAARERVVAGTAVPDLRHDYCTAHARQRHR